MKAVLYDVEWQVLRVRLLNDNSDDGGWTTVEGTQRNLHMLTEYLSGYCLCCKEQEPCELKKYRVKNCLNAVRMGYSGQGLTGSDMDGIVGRYKKDLHYDAFAVQREADLWDWNKQQAALEQLKTEDIDAFKSVLGNLQRRRRNANKRNAGMRHRDELSKFLSLMEQA